MELQRAREIINASDDIEVLWNGTPVWIESLDPESETATVKPLEGVENLAEVPVARLEEN